jgi:anti-sigma regulatory factor (Ser/Thr protein kinase)
MLLPPWHTLVEPGLGLTESFTAVRLRLPAESSELRRARDEVAAAGTEFGLPHKACYELVFAVNEAVTNAIRHGSPADDGTIGLRIEAEGDDLICSVSDCGPFVPPRRQRNMATEEGGRGFAFMAALTDQLELNVEPNETVVELRKRRVADAAGANV